jgi:hypothetical protein
LIKEKSESTLLVPDIITFAMAPQYLRICWVIRNCIGECKGFFICHCCALDIVAYLDVEDMESYEDDAKDDYTEETDMQLTNSSRSGCRSNREQKTVVKRLIGDQRDILRGVPCPFQECNTYGTFLLSCLNA